MKKGLLALPAALLLASCGMSGVTTTGVILGSNYTLGQAVTYNGTYYPKGTPVICDDRQTTLNYSFDYYGDLHHWSSELYGVTTGAVSDYKEFYLTSYPPANGRVTVSNYVVGAGTVPLSNGGGVAAQGITVVPAPTVIGQTKVRITAYDSFGNTDLKVYSRELPVVQFCVT